MWVWDAENKRMVNKEITYVPGFFKIVDEILVNAADNKVRCMLCAFNPNALTTFVDQRPWYGHH